MNADPPADPGMPADGHDERWRQLLHYWQSKHVDSRPPARGDIDPVTEIPRLVANLMLMDATDEGFVYRFVGTEVVEHTGQDMTGQIVGQSRKYAFVQPQWIEQLEFVKANRQPRLLTYRFPGQTSARQLVLLLPLHAVEGGVVKILGGSFFDGYYPPGLQADGISVLDISG